MAILPTHKVFWRYYGVKNWGKIIDVFKFVVVGCRSFIIIIIIINEKN